MSDLISRKAAIDALDNLDYMPGEWAIKGLTICKDAIRNLPSAQPEQKAEELLPDGTLHFCTDTDLSKVTRVWVSQNGTHYGDLYYADGETERWIPCSERLPEESGRYLVTRGLNACGSLWNRIYIANYSDLMGIKSEKIWWQGNVGKSDFERLDDVLAWMPLPEPYKEGKNDTD